MKGVLGLLLIVAAAAGGAVIGNAVLGPIGGMFLGVIASGFAIFVLSKADGEQY